MKRIFFFRTRAILLKPQEDSSLHPDHFNLFCVKRTPATGAAEALGVGMFAT